MPEQDFAEVGGTGVVSGIGQEKAHELASIIRRTQQSHGVRWGRPRITDDGVRVTMTYGPVLGAWPADLRRALLRMALQLKTVHVVEVANTSRKVIALRADYDKLVKAHGKDEARRRLMQDES